MAKLQVCTNKVWVYTRTGSHSTWGMWLQKCQSGYENLQHFVDKPKIL